MTDVTNTGGDAQVISSDSAPVDACPIGPAVDVLLSRWTTAVLWTLLEHGVQRFVELRRRIGSITAKVLTQRLRQLERDGLVVRRYYAEVPPRVEYEITELGRSLEPLFAELTSWGRDHAAAIEQARSRYDSRPATPSRRPLAVPCRAVPGQGLLAGPPTEPTVHDQAPTGSRPLLTLRWSPRR